MITKTLKNILYLFGVNVTRLPSRAALTTLNNAREDEKKARLEEEIIKSKWLKDLNIKTILDIGANTGQFATKIHTIFPESYLYSFEPLEECFQELINNFSDNELFKGFNIALGNEEGELTIHKNEYSPSSSILPMADLHKNNFVYTKNATQEVIRIARLDDFANNLKIIKPLLVKIDVQGFEAKVIEGGRSIIGSASVIICELSMEKLYEEQPLFDDIYKMLTELGFQYKGNYEQLLSPIDGRVLQADGIFIRT